MKLFEAIINNLYLRSIHNYNCILTCNINFEEVFVCQDKIHILDSYKFWM